MFSLKQFRHYLLGRRFKLYIDHAPLQWLSAQKMEGMLCRWSLAIQEYDFAIVYRKGSANSNALYLYFKDKGLCLYIHKKLIMYLAILITIQNQISNYCSVCPAVF